MEFGIVSGNRLRGRRNVSLAGAATSQQTTLEAALRQRKADRENQLERREKQEERNRRERSERLAHYQAQEKLREEERQRVASERAAALERARVAELERRRLEEATRKREERRRQREERRHDLSGDCPVCMEPLADDAVLLNCPHCVCRDCWTNWRRTCDRKRRQRSCPVCRAEVDPLTDESEPPSPESSSDELEIEDEDALEVIHNMADIMQFLGGLGFQFSGGLTETTNQTTD